MVNQPSANSRPAPALSLTGMMAVSLRRWFSLCSVSPAAFSSRLRLFGLLGPGYRHESGIPGVIAGAWAAGLLLAGVWRFRDAIYWHSPSILPFFRGLPVQPVP